MNKPIITERRALVAAVMLLLLCGLNLANSAWVHSGVCDELGAHIPAGYLYWAWESASPSLKKALAGVGKKQADDVIFNAFLTGGQRAIIRADVIIEICEGYGTRIGG